MVKNNNPNNVRARLHTKDFNDAKTCLIGFRTTTYVKKRLGEVWKIRTFPDPRDPTHDLKFLNQSEYLEFIIRCMNDCGDKFWYFIKHVLNPSFPKGD